VERQRWTDARRPTPDGQMAGRETDTQTDRQIDKKEGGGLTVTLSRTKGRGGRSGRSAMQCNGEGEGKGEAGGLGEWSSRASSRQWAGRRQVVVGGELQDSLHRQRAGRS
jgi:hypothetical protein